MRRLALLLLVAVAVPAAPAFAGGWATVELDAMPTGLRAGEPWNVELIVKQHGVTPLDDANPSLRITNDAGVVQTFRAKHTGRPGTYAAVVTFPSNGTWQTRIFDGWADTTIHRLAPLTVGPAGGGATKAKAPKVAPAPASAPAIPVVADDGGAPWPQIVAIAAVVLLLMGGWMALSGWPSQRWSRRRAAAGQRYLPTQ